MPAVILWRFFLMSLWSWRCHTAECIQNSFEMQNSIHSARCRSAIQFHNRKKLFSCPMPTVEHLHRPFVQHTSVYCWQRENVFLIFLFLFCCCSIALHVAHSIFVIIIVARSTSTSREYGERKWSWQWPSARCPLCCLNFDIVQIMWILCNWCCQQFCVYTRRRQPVTAFIFGVTRGRSNVRDKSDAYTRSDTIWCRL